MGVRYPNVTVELVGHDGNAFSILGRVTRELRRAGVSDQEVQAYTDEASSGDYDHLLRVTMHTVSIE